jgi:hypothetical protein
MDDFDSDGILGQHVDGPAQLPNVFVNVGQYAALDRTIS